MQYAIISARAPRDARSPDRRRRPAEQRPHLLVERAISAFLHALLAGIALGLLVGFALGRALVSTAPATLHPEVPLNHPPSCPASKTPTTPTPDGPGYALDDERDPHAGLALERARAEAQKSRWLCGGEP